MRNCETNPKPVPTKRNLSGRARRKAAFYAEAQRLFVEEGLSTKEIAEKIPVGRTTAARWCAEGGWLQLRKEFVQSTAGAAAEAKMVLQNIITELGGGRANGETVSPKELDQMAKVAATVQKLEAITTPRRAFVMFASKFALWCQEHYAQDEDFIARLIDAIQGYGNVILEADDRA
ncbi:MAG: hypothetical protein JSV08_07935 [Acidobacteriota bacterium]|nr:MAG: hypothetical protein JSV08_07935 [Acidobacteriota bacterium]